MGKPCSEPPAMKLFTTAVNVMWKDMGVSTCWLLRTLIGPFPRQQPPLISQEGALLLGLSQNWPYEDEEKEIGV